MDIPIQSKNKKLQQPPKTHIGDFSIHLGPLMARGFVLPTEGPKKGGAHLVTPNGERVRRVYADSHNKMWEESELMRVVSGESEEDETIVSADDLKEARASDLPANVFNAAVHPRKEVDDLILPDGKLYIVFPGTNDPKKAKGKQDPRNAETFQLIFTMVDSCPDLAFLSMVKFRGSEGLYRLGTWQGLLSVQKQKFPGELHTYDPPCKPLVGAQRKKLRAVAEKLVTPMSEAGEEAYRDRSAERVAALANGDKKAPKTKPTASEPSDVMAALDAFLAG